MTQQKSEDPVVPEGPRKPVPIPPIESPAGGGKGIPVEEALPRQLLLFATAENPRPKRGARTKPPVDLSTESVAQAPKATSNDRQAAAATMQRVVERLDEALDKVEANDGAPGPDRTTISQLREAWSEIQPQLARTLLAGRFQPGDIRRVWIAKSGGGQRGLGIPNVIDRVVQEAVRATLEPLYEPTFHASSHGFRPNRSCHTAIAEAQEHIAAGHRWVVDIDLEKFFDRVNHQRLEARLATQIGDRDLRVLIGRMLRAGVIMPDGVRTRNEEGVPQGGPLSPLLSNIVLHELDEELTRRGLRFVRYADDCNIYVASHRAGERVMESITRFIERRLRLKVNQAKSAVAEPETRHFLGFRLRPLTGTKPAVLLSERSEQRLKARLRELTPRNAGRSIQSVVGTVNQYLRGWDGFFRICTRDVERVLSNADAHLRRRLRALHLAHWKTKRTIARNLIRMGAPRKSTWTQIYRGRRQLWALSICDAVHRGMPNSYFKELGLVSLLDLARARWGPAVAPGEGAAPSR